MSVVTDMKAKAAYSLAVARGEQQAAARARMRRGCGSHHAVGRRAHLLRRSPRRQAFRSALCYRHFPTRNDLQSGLWEWILANLTHVDFGATTTDEWCLSRCAARSQASTRGAPLIQAMLHSPQGLEVRQGQQPQRRAMFEACIDAAVPDAPADVRMRAAAALQVLYSATSWELLRTFWGMDAAQAGDVIELAIRSSDHRQFVSPGCESSSERARPDP